MGGNRIGVHQYHNITSVSALETLDQVTLEVSEPILIRGVWVDQGVGARVVSMSRDGMETDGISVWGQVQSSCSRDWQRRQCNRVGQGGSNGFLETAGRIPGGFPSIIVALLNLIRRTWVGEDGGVSYEPIRQLSSRDEGGDGDGEEEGGEIFPVSSRLWWMRAQSCCAMNSAMNARGMTYVEGEQQGNGDVGKVVVRRHVRTGGQ